MDFSWQKQFPGFSESEIPTIPAEYDFVDTSWHNNASPSFTSDKLGLHLWVNYADAGHREYKVPRFLLERQGHGIEIGESVVETENWDDVLEAMRLQVMDAAALNDWYEGKVGYRPQADDPSMQVGDLRSLCQEYLQASIREGAQ